MLTAVWRGYDILVKDVLVTIDMTQADEELERSMTQLLEPRIHQTLSGDEPYYIRHGPYEYATRRPARLSRRNTISLLFSTKIQR